MLPEGIKPNKHPRALRKTNSCIIVKLKKRKLPQQIVEGAFACVLLNSPFFIKRQGDNNWV